MSHESAGAAPWTVRPGTEEDIPAILELFEATFGKRTSEAAYRWKFLHSPRPIAAPTTFVAAVGDRIVGHFGGTPMRLRIGREDLPAVHGCDTMVAADFRRRGIISSVIRSANEAWASAGASLQLALPTEDFERLREPLGYRPTFRLGWLWRPLVWMQGRRSRGLDVRPVEAAGSEFDQLWEEVKGDDGATVVRDRAWIAYRYHASPLEYRTLLARKHGRPIGYIVYRRPPKGRSAWIADLYGLPEGRPALLRAAFSELRRAGAADVRIFAARGTSLWKQLLRAGFLRRRGAYDVRVVQLAPELPWDLLRDPRRFFLMGGDFDVV